MWFYTYSSMLCSQRGDRQKRFSQNERKRADLQKVASDFLIFALGLSYDLSIRNTSKRAGLLR